MTRFASRQVTRLNPAWLQRLQLARRLSHGRPGMLRGDDPRCHPHGGEDHRQEQGHRHEEHAPVYGGVPPRRGQKPPFRAHYLSDAPSVQSVPSGSGQLQPICRFLHRSDPGTGDGGLPASTRTSPCGRTRRGPEGAFPATVGHEPLGGTPLGDVDAVAVAVGPITAGESIPSASVPIFPVLRPANARSGACNSWLRSTRPGSITCGVRRWRRRATGSPRPTAQ
jgi:hypothetical protein